MAAGDDDNQRELVEKIQAQLMRRYGNTSRESMEKLFKVYDKDRNGKISDGELSDLLKDAGVGNGFTRGMWVSGIIQKLDANKDGEIDWREFSESIGAR